MKAPAKHNDDNTRGIGWKGRGVWVERRHHVHHPISHVQRQFELNEMERNPRETDLQTLQQPFSCPWENAYERLNVICVESSCARRPLTYFGFDDEIRDGIVQDFTF